jgi:PAS domain S-box-containing protein
MTETQRRERRWLVLGLVVASGIAVLDWLVSTAVIPAGLIGVSLLLVAARAGPQATAVAVAYGLVLVTLLGIRDHDFGSANHLLRVLVVTAGGGLAIWVSSLRERAQSKEERATFIAEAGTRLDTSLDYETTANTLARLAVPWLADWCAVYVNGDGGVIKQLSVAHSDPAREEIAWELERRWPFHVDQPTGVGHVMRSGQAEMMREIPQSAIETNAYDPDHARLVRDLGLRSAMFVPLRARGTTLGVMAFATAESGRKFDASDFAVAENLADRAAQALDNAALHTRLVRTEAELRRSAEELEAVFQGVASAITVRDPSGRIMYANLAAAQLLGFSSVEALLESTGENILERFEVFDLEGNELDVNHLPGRVALTGVQPPDALVRLKDKATGRELWTVIKATPILDERGKTTMAINIFEDVTKQKRDELAERFLSDSSRLLAASLDYETMLDNVAHAAVPSFADWCAVELLTERGTPRPAAVAHADPSKVELLEAMFRRHGPWAGAGGVGKVIATGDPEHYPDFAEALAAGAVQDEEQLAMLREAGNRSAIIVPLKTVGKTIGTLVLVTGESRRRFDKRDVAVAEELALRAATAIENARLYDERSHIAHTLQKSLLPPVLPHIPGVELASRFRAAGEGYEVGGDFYDVFNTGNAWGMVIGDVCGKGPDAAALTGLARHTLRAAAMQETAPSKILGLLSEAIMRERVDSQFCTAVYACLELESVGARMIVSVGGHPQPLFLSEDGRVEPVGSPGTLLGSIPDPRLSDHELDLNPGAAVIFYTDGVIEAGKPRGAFGLEGLRSLLGSCAGLAAHDIAERIDQAVMGLDSSPSDDVAILVVRISE